MSLSRRPGLGAARASVLLLSALLHRRAASFSARRLKQEVVRPRAKQSLGQNFLKDVNLARKIAGSVVEAGEGGDRVIELGPGQGAITSHLLERFPDMRAVEIDERMIGVLRQSLPTLDVAHGDMLQLDFGELAAARGGRLSVVSNTPYYLTSPLLFKLCGATEHIDSAVLTMQREVCDRILSPPSSKEYGILSVMLQLFGRPAHLFDIPPEAFTPAPSPRAREPNRWHAPPPKGLWARAPRSASPQSSARDGRFIAGARRAGRTARDGVDSRAAQRSPRACSTFVRPPSLWARPPRSPPHSALRSSGCSR